MSVIIRLQRLPWSASALDIRRCFNGLSIPDGGVHIIGGENGDAFIAFSSDEDARLAMQRDGQRINDSAIKLLLSSKTEMQTVLSVAKKEKIQNRPSDQNLHSVQVGQSEHVINDPRNRNLPPYPRHDEYAEQFSDRNRYSTVSHRDTEFVDQRKGPRHEHMGQNFLDSFPTRDERHLTERNQPLRSDMLSHPDPTLQYDRPNEIPQLNIHGQPHQITGLNDSRDIPSNENFPTSQSARDLSTQEHRHMPDRAPLTQPRRNEAGPQYQSHHPNEHSYFNRTTDDREQIQRQGMQQDRHEIWGPISQDLSPSSRRTDHILERLPPQEDRAFKRGHPQKDIGLIPGFHDDERRLERNRGQHRLFGHPEHRQMPAGCHENSDSFPQRRGTSHTQFDQKRMGPDDVRRSNFGEIDKPNRELNQPVRGPDIARTVQNRRDSLPDQFRQGGHREVQHPRKDVEHLANREPRFDPRHPQHPRPELLHERIPHGNNDNFPLPKNDVPNERNFHGRNEHHLGHSLHVTSSRGSLLGAPGESQRDNRDDPRNLQQPRDGAPGDFHQQEQQRAPMHKNRFEREGPQHRFQREGIPGDRNDSRSREDRGHMLSGEDARMQQGPAEFQSVATRDGLLGKRPLIRGQIHKEPQERNEPPIQREGMFWEFPQNRYDPIGRQEPQQRDGILGEFPGNRQLPTNTGHRTDGILGEFPRDHPIQPNVVNQEVAHLRDGILGDFPIQGGRPADHPEPCHHDIRREDSFIPENVHPFQNAPPNARNFPHRDIADQRDLRQIDMGQHDRNRFPQNINWERNMPVGFSREQFQQGDTDFMPRDNRRADERVDDMRQPRQEGNRESLLGPGPRRHGRSPERRAVDRRDRDPRPEQEIRDSKRQREDRNRDSQPNAKKAETCIQLKGLAETATYSDVEQVFAGCGINAIKLLSTSKDCPAGICFVKFITEGDRRKALQRNGLIYKSRFLQINTCSNEDFYKADEGPTSKRDRLDSSSAQTATRMDSGDNGGYWVVIRNLPVSANRNKILNLFKDHDYVRKSIFAEIDVLNFCLGNAYLEFTSSDSRKKALKLHRQREIDRNAIDVIEIPFEDMHLRILQHKAWLRSQHELSEKSSPLALLQRQTFCVEIKGMLFSVTDSDIEDFFRGLRIVPRGIHYSRKANGSHTGIGYVEFQSKNDFEQALRRNGQFMGKRYIHVSLINRNDMIRKLDLESKSQFIFSEFRGKTDVKGKVDDRERRSSSKSENRVDNDLNSQAKRGCVVGVQNLPTETSVKDILTFFRRYNPLPDNTILHTKDGKFAGDAVVGFSNVKDTQSAIRDKNNQKMGGKTVLVYLKSDK